MIQACLPRRLVALFRLLLKDRTQFALENIALRQQLAVHKRTVKRPKIEDRDRIFWMSVMGMLKEWKEALVFVQPETVLRWHRNGFAYYWRRKSRANSGRPPIGMDLIMLIRRMSQENVLWGAPRIRDELALLGHEVAESTVAKYMVKRRNTEPSQSWKSFIQNHMAEAAACDFFVVPSLTFDLLFCFVALSHDRRRILHINVTKNPTALCTARQLIEAFPFDTKPKYLHRDRDAIYGWAFERCVESLDIRQIISAPRSPWQNAFVERVIGTLQRECTDHIIPLNEEHLRWTLLKYVEYYNGGLRARTSRATADSGPLPSWRQGCLATPRALWAPKRGPVDALGPCRDHALAAGTWHLHWALGAGVLPPIFVRDLDGLTSMALFSKFSNLPLGPRRAFHANTLSTRILEPSR